jgi:hypothetical protein
MYTTCKLPCILPVNPDKTLQVTALAGALGRPIYVISLSSKGMSDESLRALLNSAAPRCMLLLEVGSRSVVLPAAAAGSRLPCCRLPGCLLCPVPHCLLLLEVGGRPVAPPASAVADMSLSLWGRLPVEAPGLCAHPHGRAAGSRHLTSGQSEPH